MSITSYEPPQPQRTGLAIPLLAGGLIALAAANIYLYVQLDHLQTDTTQKVEKLTTAVAGLRDASSVSTAAQARHIDALKAELASVNAQSRNMSSEAKVEAQAHADQLARQLQAEEAKMQQQMTGQISEVNQSVTAANAKIADVSTDVGAVKSQAAMTQSQLEKTISDLKSVNGDLGVQSGLIATNGRELQALKLKGERNYFDIKLGKTKTAAALRRHHDEAGECRPQAQQIHRRRDGGRQDPKRRTRTPTSRCSSIPPRAATPRTNW